MPQKQSIKVCKYHGKQTFVHDNHTWRCKICRTEAVKKRRYKVKIKAIQYKGGKCERCGYDKCPAALDFHHKNPNKKDFAISRGGVTLGWSTVQKELDKCELICANCHREEHYDPHGIAALIER